MPDLEVKRILAEVICCIDEIDQECSTLLNDIEHGLINVRLEFRDRAIEDLGKRLTEETLIAWMIWQKLGARGWDIEWEVAYPANRRKKCDLVVHFSETRHLWLELKLASKAWFNCEGDPDYSNSLYRSYLQGSNRTHSFQHDFHKLALAGGPWSADDYRAVCLIGFDWIKDPIDDEVGAITHSLQNDGHVWSLVSESHWADRRSTDFRINVWCWLLSSFQSTDGPSVSHDRNI